MAEVKVSTAGLVEVTVTSPFQVSFDGALYGPGSLVSIVSDVAEDWIRCGWVTRT
jgi:hypothetical protein